MYTQHSEIRMGQVVPVEKGRTVQLLAQTENHKAIFQGAGDSEPTTMAASEFFQTHRQAYPAECAAFEKAAKAELKTKQPAD